MDPGTVVASVVGAAAVAQFIVNRRDTNARNAQDRLDTKFREERARDADLERRWVQEKRLIYVKAQAVLSDLLDAETGILTEPLGSADRQAAIDADNAAWMLMNDVHAELDLLAPDAVRDAVFAADQTLDQVGATLLIDEVPMHPDPIGAATEACRAALNAMRADLGIGPVNEWRSAIDDLLLAVPPTRH